MKIAVCLFGHVGGKTGSDGDGGWLDVSSSLLNFIELHKAYDIDYFIHSWSVLEEEKICELLKPSAKLFEPQIQFKYPLSKYNLEGIENYRALFEAYDSVEKILKPLIYRSHSRWYSTSNSITLMKQFSEKNKIHYDWVLQLRFDLHFFKSISFEKLDPKYFYAPARTKQKDIAIEDLFFVSSYKNAVLFSTIYDHLFEYCIRPPVAAKQHLDSLGIKNQELFQKGKEYNLKRALQVNTKKNLSTARIINGSLSRIQRFISVLKKILDLLIKLLEKIKF